MGVGPRAVGFLNDGFRGFVMVDTARRPIRSKEERAVESDARAGAESLEAPSGEGGTAADTGLEDLRLAVQAHGFNLVKERGMARGRPAVQGDGRVRVTTRIAPGLRDAMQAARWELGLTVSGFIEEALVWFLESQGLRAEGVRPPGDPRPVVHPAGDQAAGD